MSDGVMTYEDWLRGCVHHDGRHGYVTLPCDEVLKIADFIERLRADRKTENSSEKPNNCEHITEDGVTCAKYPACDDCLDNPLNKVKGSERLVKGSEKPNNWEDFFREPTAEERKAVADYIDSISVPTGVNIFDLMDNSTISKMEQVDEPKTEPCDGCVCDDGKHLMYCMNCKGIAWKTEPPKVEDEPQTDGYISGEDFLKIFDEPQTERSE